MAYTSRSSDYELWESLLATADRENSPEWRFGKYVHSVQTRETLRQTPEGRADMMRNLPGGHEQTADIAPFVFWDGEGITYEQGMPQSYVLFGSSLGHEICAPELHTDDCLALLIQAERDMPHAIHAGFAFKYDSEMILQDLSLRHWHVLRKRGTVHYRGYRVTYRPGRMFRVSKMEGDKRITCTVYDVWGFFQASFVAALRKWLDEDEIAEIDRIESGKHARGSFTYEQIDDMIRPYWQAELRLGTVLCERLRERVVSADLCPREWHGAGALASTLYRRHNMRQHIARTDRDRLDRDRDTSTMPEEVNDAARHAYAGGRFELFRMGHTEQRVYQYDINSAYPNAIAQLPSLRDARWEYVTNPTFDPTLWAVWRITYDKWSTRKVFTPGPLFQRDYFGRVCYPHNVSGWYWTPEAALVANTATIHGAWILHHDDSQPFGWVQELYDERRRRKDAGDPSEKASKLALNSLYGKMAQRLGWKPGEPLPRFHQLEWAGWVTSYTRMMLYAAMKQAGRDLIAVETDAVFSTRPLNLPIGKGLGEWDMTEHAWITYLQSGTYWSDHGAKYRGFDRDSLSHDEAMDWLRKANWSMPLVGTTTRFVGAGRGLGTPLHRCWITESRDMQPGASGKRLHVQELCRACANGESAANTLHPLLTVSHGGFSLPHHLPWLDPESEANEWQDMMDVDGWDAFE